MKKIQDAYIQIDNPDGTVKNNTNNGDSPYVSTDLKTISNNGVIGISNVKLIVGQTVTIMKSDN